MLRSMLPALVVGPPIHPKVLRGELRVQEEAWLISRTVDRQFWLHPRVPPRLPVTVLDRPSGTTFLPGSNLPFMVHFPTVPSGGNTLVPGDPIYAADFASVSNGWLYHQKLGWLFFDSSSFPSF